MHIAFRSWICIVPEKSNLILKSYLWEKQFEKKDTIQVHIIRRKFSFKSILYIENFALYRISHISYDIFHN